MIALQIEQVSKIYQNNFKALDNISFNLAEGDFVGLLGVNGAGKTSLISSISGVNNFTGQISVMGYDVAKNTVPAKRRLGVVPQELAYDPFLTVAQTLQFQSGLYGLKNNQAWIDEVMERMHLEDKANSNTRFLSGGMKRRLMVAQALVHKPPVIILDEPTVGVDAQIRKNIWDFMIELNQQGHTILLTTHYLEEVERLCNQIIMLDKGRIIAQSSRQDLLDTAAGLSTELEIETSTALKETIFADLVLEQQGNHYKLKIENNSNLAPLLAQLFNNGIQVNNVTINKPKLEDIFLKYVGQ